MIRFLRLLQAFLLLTSVIGVQAAQKTYLYTFDYPMSWADDAAPWATDAVQGWYVTQGSKSGNALRISGEKYSRSRSYEIRTLQFNHQPNTPVTISFDVKGASVPSGSFMMVRYFDGYCVGSAFHRVADDLLHPFPAPVWDSRNAGSTANWRHVTFKTPNLKNTVVTIALIVQQPPLEGLQGAPEYVDFYMDNLRVETTALDRLMDMEFDWHGNYGNTTSEFRHNTMAANADWCDFADQEDVETEKGVIHYTLFQFRDATTQKNPGTRHYLAHDQHASGVGGFSTVHTSRWSAGTLSAASWGVRQTVSYESLGIKPNEQAKVRVTMRMTNLDHDSGGVTTVQLGVDPYGGAITQKAKWTQEDHVNFRTDQIGWRTPSIIIDKPKDAEAFTIYFRNRDGLPKPARDKSYPSDPKEVQSAGTNSACDAYADWVKVEKMVNGKWVAVQ